MVSPSQQRIDIFFNSTLMSTDRLMWWKFGCPSHSAHAVLRLSFCWERNAVQATCIREKWVSNRMLVRKKETSCVDAGSRLLLPCVSRFCFRSAPLEICHRRHCQQHAIRSGMISQDFATRAHECKNGARTKRLSLKLCRRCCTSIACISKCSLQISSKYRARSCRRRVL
jgi:hypothetical protein